MRIVNRDVTLPSDSFVDVFRVIIIDASSSSAFMFVAAAVTPVSVAAAIPQLHRFRIKTFRPQETFPFFRNTRGFRRTQIFSFIPNARSFRRTQISRFRRDQLFRFGRLSCLSLCLQCAFESHSSSSSSSYSSFPPSYLLFFAFLPFFFSLLIHINFADALLLNDVVICKKNRKVFTLYQKRNLDYLPLEVSNKPNQSYSIQAHLCWYAWRKQCFPI